MSMNLREQLLKEDLFKNNTENYIKEIGVYDNLIVWGCGQAGLDYYNFLKNNNLHNKIKNYADNNMNNWGAEVNNLSVLSPKEVIEKVKNNSTCIIIASLHLIEIKKQLKAYGIHENNIDIKGYYISINNLSYTNDTPFINIKSNFEKYEEVFSYLCDDFSKEVYVNLLNTKISLDTSYMEGISNLSHEQYFDNNLINFISNEVFCDCGSYNGDTLEQFITLTKGKYEKYIAFEADKDTYKELCKKIDERNYNNITVYNIACWNEKKTLYFEASDTSGHITDKGNISIKADALDNILENEKITFLKMDIEGAEEMALLGAQNIIKNNKPLLAICIYHKLEDYYKIPLLIKKFNPDYSIYIRQYTDMVDVETVCYAIPKDRLIN